MVTFAQLHYILPTARDVSYDAEIYALDKRIFGFEPAEAWDTFVSPATTEWFSFFYYLYFGILAVHVVPMALLERRVPVLREFSWGIFWVFCIGQVVYMVVPGFGPYRLLGPSFTHPLEGRTFWPLVQHTVASFEGSRRTDIFPSLHTAVPSFFTLFAIRHRDKVPFRYTWPVMAFVTANIIVATMLLRWHYLLDVVAGLTLATSAFLTARCLPAKEDAYRARTGRPPVWRPLFGPEPIDDAAHAPPCFGVLGGKPREPSPA
jgi:membrane-associated phospholipid phosphatase